MEFSIVHLLTYSYKYKSFSGYDDIWLGKCLAVPFLLYYMWKHIARETFIYYMYKQPHTCYMINYGHAEKISSTYSMNSTKNSKRETSIVFQVLQPRMRLLNYLTSCWVFTENRDKMTTQLMILLTRVREFTRTFNETLNMTFVTSTVIG